MLLPGPILSALGILLNDDIFVKVEVGMLKFFVSTEKIGPTMLFPIPLKPHMMTMFNAPNAIPKGIELVKKDFSFEESILTTAEAQDEWPGIIY